jgi:hypothetical protein
MKVGTPKVIRSLGKPNKEANVASMKRAKKKRKNKKKKGKK